jgi:hypothetical protein
MLKPFFVRKIIYSSAVLASLFVQHTVSAQQDYTLFNMQAVPQRMYANPAFRPTDTTIFIGLPVLSSEYLSFGNSGFKYSDLIRPDGDSLKADVANMISKLAKENYISLAYHIDLLSFGFGLKKNYFSFNATERVELRFGYSKDFFNFLWLGNGDPSTLGQPVNLAPSLNIIHYREYGFGWSRHINDKLTVGGKLKYLYGEENVSTGNTNASLTTDPNDFALTGQANIDINTAGVGSNSFNNFNVMNYLFKKKNGGAAIDLGGTYKYTDNITFSVSLTDLGFITWNTDVTNYESHTANASFTYNGIDLDQFINNKSLNFGTVMQKTGDSAAKIFKIDTLHHTYTTMLTAQMYLGANYLFPWSGNAAILLHGEIYDKALHPSLTLSYNQTVGRWLTASIDYSIYNRSYNNIGFGMAHNLGPVQLYIVSDNVLGFLQPQNAQNIMFHFGINISWVHKRPAQKKAQL